MSSRSSNRRPAAPLPLGRIAGFRAREGELTVRVVSGEASRWTGLSRVLVSSAKPRAEPRAYEVERARAYRDRLVLKLRGVDDPSAAAALKGRTVFAASADVPELPEGTHYLAWLAGLEVRDADDAVVGTVEDVMETAGHEVLVVRSVDGHEVLIPLTRAIVPEVHETEGWLRVNPPAGLIELNRSRGARR